MIEHLDAFRAAAARLGYPVFDLTVRGDVRPPWLLLGYQPLPPQRLALTRAARHLEMPIFLTYTAGTPLGVLEMITDARTALEGIVLEVAGRKVHPLTVESYAGVSIDTDAVISGTSIHPAFAIDTWTIASTTL
ncbi:hypothetical protein JT358_11575 [Micrococcales bacterium 31B]|nr:hypothetical protein [Micrococcales bacterium 31B]